MTETTNQSTAEATEVKLTPREKLCAKYEKLVLKAQEIAADINEIVQSIKDIDAIASIAVGTAVIITTGKGETLAEVEAVVVGVKEDEDGSKVYKVQYGVGFDADIAVVKQGKIKLPPTSEAAQTPAE